MIGLIKAGAVLFFYFFLFALIFSGLVYTYRLWVSLVLFCGILAILKMGHRHAFMQITPHLDVLGRKAHLFCFLFVVLGATLMAVLSLSPGPLLALLPLFFVLGVVCALDHKIGSV